MLENPNEINIAVVLKIPQALKTEWHHSKHNMHVRMKALKSPCGIAYTVVSSAEFLENLWKKKEKRKKRSPTSHVFQDLITN